MKIILSKTQWELIGYKTGWLKKEAAEEEKTPPQDAILQKTTNPFIIEDFLFYDKEECDENDGWVDDDIYQKTILLYNTQNEGFYKAIVEINIEIRPEEVEVGHTYYEPIYKTLPFIYFDGIHSVELYFDKKITDANMADENYYSPQKYLPNPLMRAQAEQYIKEYFEKRAERWWGKKQISDINVEILFERIYKEYIKKVKAQPPYDPS